MCTSYGMLKICGADCKFGAIRARLVCDSIGSCALDPYVMKLNMLIEC